MNSSEVRNTFLKYFKKNNHKIIHSSSLVPENDLTLMFVNSGMVQFKNIFTGKEIKDYTKAVTAQKCVRAGGKHNDLENVGYTARHHTFFEMLGNFSFGDYFKEEAINLAWNLITKEFGIDKKKLLVTVFSEDKESHLLWKKISGLGDDKIIKIATADNFWSMGDIGPCGPCSEIFYDHGEDFFGGPPGSKNEDGDRFIEIWNLVFMQYEQISKNKRIDLPEPSIDTGMGLERVVALLQNTNDNYKTDIFSSLIEKSINLSNNDNPENLSSHKVIADHLRSASFLISDGVLPSNEGRGYVLRRIMRRGMRHAHSLGNKDPIFHKIFPILLSEMKNSYPELLRAKDLILNTLYKEEEKFKLTIDKGIKILEDEIKNSSNKLFHGAIAFKLYDTYGFPLDLTQDYLKNKQMKVNIDQFNSCMLDQKNRAKGSWKGSGEISINNELFDFIKELDQTLFLGYEKNNSDSLVIKIINNNRACKKIVKGNKAIIVLNQTPFYGESGGQIGDEGLIFNRNFQFIVNNTTKIFGKYFMHIGEVISGECSEDDHVKTKINTQRKKLIKSNHSATHLLHSSLRKILGNHVTQKGSLVNDEKLRFDFSHHDSITSDNILKIEKLVNTVIDNKLSIETQILDHKSAINSGAMALFGEKYGDNVRVVSMGKKENNIVSKELCGGTHLKNTGEIYKFKIISQSSVGSGVRRIEAVTNITVDKYIAEEIIKNDEKNNKIKEEIKRFMILMKKIDYNKIINFKNKNLEDNLKELKSIYTSNKESIDVKKNFENISVKKIGKINFIYLITKDYPIKSQKNFIDDQKKIYFKESIIMLVSTSVNKVSILLGLSNDLTSKINATDLVKKASLIVGGSGGGGRGDLAQAGGNLPNKAKNIYNEIADEIEKLF